MSTDWARMKDDEDFAKGLEPRVYGEEQKPMRSSIEGEDIFIGSNASDPAYRKATNLEQNLSESNSVGVGEALDDCLNQEFKAISFAVGFTAVIAGAGYGIYKLVQYLGDKF